jgi:hypothetical protein
LPLRSRQHGAKVPYRHLMIIDRAGLFVTAFIGSEMRDDLVSKNWLFIFRWYV